MLWFLQAKHLSESNSYCMFFFFYPRISEEMTVHFYILEMAREHT